MFVFNFLNITNKLFFPHLALFFPSPLHSLLFFHYVRYVGCAITADFFLFCCFYIQKWIYKLLCSHFFSYTVGSNLSIFHIFSFSFFSSSSLFFYDVLRKQNEHLIWIIFQMALIQKSSSISSFATKIYIENEQIGILCYKLYFPSFFSFSHHVVLSLFYVHNIWLPLPTTPFTMEWIVLLEMIFNEIVKERKCLNCWQKIISE